MALSRGIPSLPFKIANKQRRQAWYHKQKKVSESQKRDDRMKRKREEAKTPGLREKRLAQNIPITLERKRAWDDIGGDEEDALGLSVDVERLKRRKTEEEAAQAEAQLVGENEEDSQEEEEEDDEDDADSMLDDDEDADSEEDEESTKATKRRQKSQSPPRQRASSPGGSTASTNLALTPDVLMSKFPSLFEPPAKPKILITTSTNSTLHFQAQILTTMFPNSQYIRRTAHHYAHKYSIREIASFASNRAYTTLIILMEDQKRPSGLDVVHLPNGPMFHFSISNWVEGRKLPGHGNPTNHFPELILNNFRTPLGLLTAHLFRTMFPVQPELVGRQVVTLHNQRDYIFVRRHRYVFRDKRKTEKSVVDSEGKPVKGVEEIRAGLQELGPRFTLKLRRIDRGIQRASGQEWQWKAGMEKQRTRFNL
ncbi:Brix-domain-containing protein [Aulographum hederae CBS 113979]|uniref:Brix-domain-containing protein n=1 Tax=Aulographum hederae CBS 113979 TaxID=1176131 RepID=A0A6G1GR22_9PEZI|nr:Brix-domain-containing protein [Aulographum hederae CBS 113979]